MRKAWAVIGYSPKLVSGSENGFIFLARCSWHPNYQPVAAPRFAEGNGGRWADAEGLGFGCVRRSNYQRRAIFMMLPYDPLREAILLELNRAICARRAQGISLDAFELEYGLSKEAVQLIVRRKDRNLEKRVRGARLRHRPKAGGLTVFVRRRSD
jgi:hypothetical protein